MSSQISIIKHKLAEAIMQLCEVSWMFVKKPGRDFTRKRKLSFDRIVSLLLAMEGGSLTTELLNYFDVLLMLLPVLLLFSKEAKLAMKHFLCCSNCLSRKQMPLRYIKDCE